MTEKHALLLTIDYAPQRGGVPRLLQSLIDHSGEQVHWRVLTVAPGDNVSNVDRVGNLAAMLPAAIKTARSMQSLPNARIVCAHAFLAPIAVAASRASGVPVAGLVHGWELVGDTVKRRLPLRALRSFEQVVAVSNHSAGIVSKWVDALSVQVVLPEFVSPLRSSPPLERRAQQPLEVVAITRLTEGYKNIEVVLRALAIVRSIADARLTVVGDGPRRPVLLQKAAALGVDDIVQFTGSIDDQQLEEVVANSHVGVVPSRQSITDGGFEGFGLVVQELAGAGLPVISGKAAGVVDALHPEWSIDVDPDDTQAWVAALRYLLDENVRFGMAEQAWKWGGEVDSHRTAMHFVDAFYGEVVM